MKLHVRFMKIIVGQIVITPVRKGEMVCCREVGYFIIIDHRRTPFSVGTDRLLCRRHVLFSVGVITSRQVIAAGINLSFKLYLLFIFIDHNIKSNFLTITTHFM